MGILDRPWVVRKARQGRRGHHHRKDGDEPRRTTGAERPGTEASGRMKALGGLSSFRAHRAAHEVADPGPHFQRRVDPQKRLKCVEFALLRLLEE